jgi:tetratricopeptide (TPR) repeat protein
VPLLQQALQLKPDSGTVHAALAATVFAQAEKEWKTSPGSSQAKEGFRQVVEEARRATELRPDQAGAYLHWGLALKYLGKPAAAIPPLRKGVACLPDDFALQLALGETLLEVGERQEAESYLENARLLDPSDPRPRQVLEQLRLKKS